MTIISLGDHITTPYNSAADDKRGGSRGVVRGVPGAQNQKWSEAQRGAEDEEDDEEESEYEYELEAQEIEQ